MHRIFLGWVFLALSSCSFAQEPPVAPVPENSGFVIARVVINGEGEFRENIYLDTGHYQWLVLTADGEHYVNVPAGKNSALYGQVVHGGAVPPGKYHLEGFANIYANNVASHQEWWFTKGAFPEIEVVPGRVTDLGTLVLQPTGPGRGVAVQWPVADGFDRGDYALLDEPALGAVTTAPVDRWQGVDGWNYVEGAVIAGGSLGDVIANKLFDGGPKPGVTWGGWPKSASYADTVARIRSRVAYFGEASESEDAAWFGSRLGQVLRRALDGSWTVIDTGLAAPIAGVVANGGDLFVAAGDGRLLRSTDQGKTWSQAEHRVEGGASRLIRLDSGDFLLLSSGLGHHRLRLYRSKEFLGLATAEPIELPEYYGGRESMQAVAGKVVIWLPPFSIIYDTATGELKSAKQKQLGTLAVAADGFLYARDTNGYKVDGLGSIDAGATWSKMNFDFVEGYGFRDRNTGFGVLIKPGWSSYKLFGLASQNGGHSWTKLGEAPQQCRQFRYLPRADKGLCLHGDGNVYSTADAATWAIERDMR